MKRTLAAAMVTAMVLTMAQAAFAGHNDIKPYPKDAPQMKTEIHAPHPAPKKIIVVEKPCPPRPVVQKIVAEKPCPPQPIVQEADKPCPPPSKKHAAANIAKELVMLIF